MSKAYRVGLIVFLLSAAGVAFAFNGHIVTEGPLKMVIGDIGDVVEVGRPREVQVTLSNSGTSSLIVGLRMAGLVDEWRAVGETKKSLVIAPGKEVRLSFQIATNRVGFNGGGFRNLNWR